MTRKQVQEWLDHQTVYTLHKTPRHRFKRSKLIFYGIDYSWSADLAYAPPNTSRLNKGINYILVCCDGLSEFLWTRPLKNKSGITVANAMLDIIKTSGRHCQLFETDAGTEFLAKEMRQIVLEPYEIHHHICLPPVKCALAEGYVKLLKRKIYRYMTYHGTKKWLEKLESFTKSLNSRFIKRLGMSPSQVNLSNEVKLFNRLHTHTNRRKLSAIFKKGDLVRIVLQKGPLGKYYCENFSKEIYQVDQLMKDNPIRYRLVNALQTPVTGTFYQQELQRVLE